MTQEFDAFWPPCSVIGLGGISTNPLAGPMEPVPVSDIVHGTPMSPQQTAYAMQVQHSPGAGFGSPMASNMMQMQSAILPSAPSPLGPPPVASTPASKAAAAPPSNSSKYVFGQAIRGPPDALGVLGGCGTNMYSSVIDTMLTETKVLLPEFNVFALSVDELKEELRLRRQPSQLNLEVALIDSTSYWQQKNPIKSSFGSHWERR